MINNAKEMLLEAYNNEYETYISVEQIRYDSVPGCTEKIATSKCLDELTNGDPEQWEKFLDKNANDIQEIRYFFSKRDERLEIFIIK